MDRIFSILVLVFTASFLQAQAKPQAKLSTPADSVLIARADAKLLAPDEAVCTRYVWIQSASDLDAKSVSLAVNLLSLNSELKAPPATAGGYLVRLDARNYAPHLEDRQRWLKTWELLRFDPSFSRLVTRDTARLVELSDGKPAMVWAWRGEWVQVRIDQLMDGDVARLPAINIPQEAMADLKAMLKTEAPIVSLPYFLFRSLTTIKDQGGNATIFGGLYYEFQGTDSKSADALLRSLGVGDGAPNFFDRIPSERRVAMWKRGPTGKPGQIIFQPTQTVLSGGWVGITGDPADGNYDGIANAMQSLLGLKVAAREYIYTKPNRLHGFALANGQGVLQQEAPAAVALAPVYMDRNGKANPHSGRLQNATSCIQCHWARDASSGFISVSNDVLTLRKRRGFVPLDDVTSRRKDLAVVQSQLEQLYAFDPDRNEKLISRARDDLSEAVLRATGPWPGGKGDQTDVVLLASTHLLGIINRYAYEPVDARDALRDLGVDPPAKLADALILWEKSLDRGTIDDVTIASIGAGLEVPRYSWSIAYSFVAARWKPPEKAKE